MDSKICFILGLQRCSPMIYMYFAPRIAIAGAFFLQASFFCTKLNNFTFYTLTQDKHIQKKRKSCGCSFLASIHLFLKPEQRPCKSLFGSSALFVFFPLFVSQPFCLLLVLTSLSNTSARKTGTKQLASCRSAFGGVTRKLYPSATAGTCGAGRPALPPAAGFRKG